MADRPNLRAPYRFAVATSGCIVLLLMAGALVTSNDAADSVPDWPLAYGRLIPPLVGGIRFEYAHRVLAGLVSILTLILAVWLARAARRPLARRLGWTALVLVIAQAVLGGVRVLEGHPAISATAHAILAQIFFITVVGLTMYLSPWWQSDLPRLN
ncbi:MAG: COX15/CtaA family protein, partial [Candidatus Acidiferrales bacterium]